LASSEIWAFNLKILQPTKILYFVCTKSDSELLKGDYTINVRICSARGTVQRPDDEHVIPVLEVNNLLERLKKANGEIHPLAFDIMEMRYGIGSKRAEKPLSLRKVAKTVNMSKDGVRKIENKALAFLSSISK
jgi:hypothetical protein